MTDPATAAPISPLIAGEMPEAPPRAFAAEVLRRTFRIWSARLGLAWIVVLAFCAVFGPFIANSFPFYARENGRLTFPLFRYLTATDVDLLAITACGVVLLLLPMRWPRRFLVMLIFVVVSTTACFIWVRPPPTAVYEEYRDKQAAGQLQSALFTMVPFSPGDHLRDRPELRLTAPSRQHLMGTEMNGADVFSRVLHASRIALSIGFIATGIAVCVGIFIGGLMGYFAGTLDILGMRLIEIFEAIPQLILLITCVAFFGRNLYLIMVIIGLTSWTGNARFIRAEFLKLRNQDFVQAAVAAGLPLRSIVFRHMLPNGISPVLVSASFGIASAILSEAILSFLGLGLIDEPSWGALLNQATGEAGTFVWWLAVYPGLAIFLTVYSYNLIGEALRDAIDPKLRSR